MAGLAPFLALAFWLVIYLNITQQKLADLAMTDMLTNLPNRRNFIAEASAALQSGVPGFMMMLVFQPNFSTSWQVFFNRSKENFVLFLKLFLLLEEH